LGAHEAVPTDQIDEFNSRLQDTSPDVTRVVHETIKAAMQAEQARTSGIDARSASMLSASGLSMTVIFTFGSGMVKHELGWEGGGSWIVAAIYVGASVFGILSAILSVRAIYVQAKSHPVPDEEAIFRTEALCPGGLPDQYLKQISVHFASIYQCLIKRHEQKLGWLRWAQRSFLAFVFLVGLLGGVIAMSSVKKSGTPAQNSQGNTSATGAKSSGTGMTTPSALPQPSALPPVRAKLVTDGQ
jgi:hypothetical protein